jgi:hypothetical protein
VSENFFSLQGGGARRTKIILKVQETTLLAELVFGLVGLGGLIG